MHASEPQADDRWIDALQNPNCYDHPVRSVERIETHISWVLLTGDYAYKIKKPVDLAFADFSTLDKRHFFCQEELRLNRRLAPQIYLGLVPITGSRSQPRINGSGDAFEFAVKMRELPASVRLDRVIARYELLPQHVDQLAASLAAFHQGAAVAPPESPYGGPQAYRPIQDTFDHLRGIRADDELQARVPALETWAQAQRDALANVFSERLTHGQVRECHGDLHLENMLLVDGQIVPFDCLEFNDRLRWIDVQSDLAFAVMDLDHRGRPDLSRRLLNQYLAATGDYSGLAVLRLFLVYRALVRAKVASIRGEQQGTDAAERNRLHSECTGFVDTAERLMRPHAPVLICTHGVSGSGKSVASCGLAEQLDAIHLRSDVERKRLFVPASHARESADRKRELYSPAATRRTYDRLEQLARGALAAGWSAIVDATFLSPSERQRQRALAAEAGVPWVVLDFEGSRELFLKRIVARHCAATDPSDADSQVLEAQLAAREPLDDDELRASIRIDAAAPPTTAELVKSIRQHVATQASQRST